MSNPLLVSFAGYFCVRRACAGVYEGLKPTTSSMHGPGFNSRNGAFSLDSHLVCKSQTHNWYILQAVFVHAKRVRDYVWSLNPQPLPFVLPGSIPGMGHLVSFSLDSH